MSKFYFQSEYQTQVYINQNEGISVTQEDPHDHWPVIIFSSKARAIQVANAILELAETASFNPDSEGDSPDV